MSAGLDDSALSSALFDASADAIVVVDGDGTIVLTNAACSVLLGYEPRALRGKSLNTLVPERFPRHDELRAEYFRNARPRPMGLGFSLAARHADGREIPVDISLSPTKSVDADSPPPPSATFAAGATGPTPCASRQQRCAPPPTASSLPTPPGGSSG